MSEEDFQRGHRGGDFGIGGDWDDWKAGRDQLERENRGAERRREQEIDAYVDASFRNVLPPDELRGHSQQRAREAEEEYNRLVASQAAVRRQREEHARNRANQKCFIATAAFGGSSPTVRLLQDYRDMVLYQSLWGAAVVRLYYRISPSLAHFITESERRRKLTRLLLRPVVTFAAHKVAHAKRASFAGCMTDTISVCVHSNERGLTRKWSQCTAELERRAAHLQRLAVL